MTIRFCAWLCLTAVAATIAGPAWPQQSVPNVALVVGNSIYPEAGTPLPTVSNDVRGLAEEFRRDGFDVDLKENIGKGDMQRAIDVFTSKIHNGTVALFYFGGFGIEVARQNYIIPVDAQISSEADVQRDGVSLDAIVAQVARKGARVKIIIIDAARQNPFERRFRSSPSGLASIDAPDGTLALYSQLPGRAVSDGKGAEGLFASELIKQLRMPNLSAEQAFTNTRLNVSHASNNDEIPWVSSTMIGDFSFGAAAATAAAQPPVAVTPQSPAAPSTTVAPQAPIAPPTTIAPQTPAAPPTPVAPPAPQPPGYKAGDIIQDCPNCGQLAVLPAGAFDMGSGDSFEGPVHHVTIAKPFAIGIREVTFAEWDDCIAEGGCKYRPDDHGWGRGDRPAIDISWLDAKDFLKWISGKTSQVYRLPSEAEWEYAARAGTASSYWWGRDVGARQANCRDCGGGGTETMPVGSFKANPFGLFDTACNVAEWAEDCWNDSYKNAPHDGSAWTAGQCDLRVLRGGAFDSQSKYLRSSARFRYDYDVRYLANGFRVVRELK
jgi:formylglycine-generating enzyme required for sulfatase activity